MEEVREYDHLSVFPVLSHFFCFPYSDLGEEISLGEEEPEEEPEEELLLLLVAGSEEFSFV